MVKKPVLTERMLAEAEGVPLASYEHIAAAIKNTSGEQFVDACIEQAKRGDTWAAEEILHTFCWFFETGQPIPNQVKRYLYLGFSKFLAPGSETPLANALGLVAPAHRRQGTLNKKGKQGLEANPVQLVANVYLLTKRDGLNKGQAVEKTDLASKNGTSGKVVN